MSGRDSHKLSRLPCPTCTGDTLHRSGICIHCHSVNFMQSKDGADYERFRITARKGGKATQRGSRWRQEDKARLDASDFLDSRNEPDDERDIWDL